MLPIDYKWSFNTLNRSEKTRETKKKQEKIYAYEIIIVCNLLANRFF